MLISKALQVFYCDAPQAIFTGNPSIARRVWIKTIGCIKVLTQQERTSVEIIICTIDFSFQCPTKCFCEYPLILEVAGSTECLQSLEIVLAVLVYYS